MKDFDYYFRDIMPISPDGKVFRWHVIPSPRMAGPYTTIRTKLADQLSPYESSMKQRIFVPIVIENNEEFNKLFNFRWRHWGN